jgi:hypothetical protein
MGRWGCVPRERGGGRDRRRCELEQLGIISCKSSV